MPSKLFQISIVAIHQVCLHLQAVDRDKGKKGKKGKSGKKKKKKKSGKKGKKGKKEKDLTPDRYIKQSTLAKF